MKKPAKRHYFSRKV